MVSIITDNYEFSQYAIPKPKEDTPYNEDIFQAGSLSTILSLRNGDLDILLSDIVIPDTPKENYEEPEHDDKDNTTKDNYQFPIYIQRHY